MIVVGIDTGKTIGFAEYNTETKKMEVWETDDIQEVKTDLNNLQPDIVVFEELTSYGLGMDAAVVRAITEVGYLCCVADDIGARTEFYTKRQWLSRLFPAVTLTKEQKAAGEKRKKITDAQVKNRVKELYGLDKAGNHSGQAVGLIWAFLQDNDQKIHRIKK